MATILQPDKTRKETVGEYSITIKEKIIPDSVRASKDVASWCKKGQPMKPCLPLGGDGKPRGITVHNTNDINVAAGTTPAEQYTRATWPNQNMAGVVVHFYVHGVDIWQNLKETERGWHATDGQTRRARARPSAGTWTPSPSSVSAAERTARIRPRSSSPTSARSTDSTRRMTSISTTTSTRRKAVRSTSAPTGAIS